MSCHGEQPSTKRPRGAGPVIALVGNANVGKSAIFNQLTGLEQAVGNWPGKTVEKAEGVLLHRGRRIRVIDLPGTYSLLARSEDERITRDFLVGQGADVIINVVDATALERNLYLSVQLLGIGTPVVVALNLVDVARKRGMIVDARRLRRLLGTEVVPTVAVQGTGVHELVDAALRVRNRPRRETPEIMRYGPEVERRIGKLEALLGPQRKGVPARWAAIKLLEGDTRLLRRLSRSRPDLANAVGILSGELSDIHREPASTVIAAERYALVGRLAREAQDLAPEGRRRGAEWLDSASMHPVWGYVLLIVIMLGILAFISVFGGWAATAIERAFESVNPGASEWWGALAWNGGAVGLYAALGVALGFLLPFYFILSLLENSGYLPRLAFLMDRPCHAMGLHGKAAVPLITAFGCNVPACVGCRIIENRRDRLIATFLSTLVPCSARTAVILGIVGTFMGPLWAMALYLVDFAIIIGLGRLLHRTMRGASVGIIMEIPPYRWPVPRLVARQAWARFRPFLVTAVPLIVLGSLAIECLRLAHALDEITAWMEPVTVAWLGLPAFTGVLFILGILRKEAAVVLLASVAGTVNIPSVMTPVQMFVFALVIMLYIPCIATIAALGREVGWRTAGLITAAEIGLAILAGGLAFRLLSPFL
ncbi:MAG: ferrous iron transport protein B [Euryarchaeota archaeon]|nr:ferrous iron transport protein B [Euryarchaeota archaeon]